MIEQPLIELYVEIPGRQHARYEHDFRADRLRLADVIYPGEHYPGDLCAVAGTLADDHSPLGALLLGNVSHPTGCLITARMLGVIEVRAVNGIRRYLVAVAMNDTHFADIATVEQLSSTRRGNIELSFYLDGGGPPAEMRWLEVEAALALLHEARQRFRLAQAKTREAQPLEPAWKPATDKNQSNRGETERHTAAEYAFYSVPYRFQQYIEEYLSLGERILYSIHRPAMKSTRQRSFLNRQRLEEGVFIISDQQVSEVVELMPPDRANIRYGFVARSSVPERLQAIEVAPLAQDVVGLTMTWVASGGIENSLWEFPASQRTEVATAARILREWLPRVNDQRLRRATPPAPPEILPPLQDPGANDPEAVKSLAARLETSLAETLCPAEIVLARCLLPEWIEKQGAASLLAITDQRLRALPDPETLKAAPLMLDIPLSAISSLQFCSTILTAYLKVFVPTGGRVVGHIIHFASTLSAMNDCYLMLRRAMAIVPTRQKALSDV